MMNETNSKDKLRCFLCGREAERLAYKSGVALHGISCKRCTDYYIDDLLVACGLNEKPADNILVSGYTRWEKALGHQVPIISVDSIEKIIRENKDMPEVMKVDKLLFYYSIISPDKGHQIDFACEFDFPIAFAKDMNEFAYLVEEVLYKSFGYIDLMPMDSMLQGYFQITPKGWQRINWIKRIDLADKKYQIESKRISDRLKKEEADKKEEAHLRGMRYSSPLAIQIGEVYLKGSLERLDTRIYVDAEIILLQVPGSTVSDKDYLIRRIKGTADAEKETLFKEISRAFRDCGQDGLVEKELPKYMKRIDNRIEEIEIDIQTGRKILGETGEAEDRKGKMIESNIDPKKIFVVHGRNEKANNAMFDFLRAVGLDPIEWGQAVSATGKGAPYIGEILDSGFSGAQAVLVLFTGDDLAKLRDEYRKSDDPDYEKNLVPQARANVIFEAGRAFGTHHDRTILVELAKEKLRPFSDVYGRYVLRISNEAESRKELVDRLKAAKCAVDTEGKTQWLKCGDFDSAALPY